MRTRRARSYGIRFELQTESTNGRSNLCLTSGKLCAQASHIARKGRGQLLINALTGKVDFGPKLYVRCPGRLNGATQHLLVRERFLARHRVGTQISLMGTAIGPFLDPSDEVSHKQIQSKEKGNYRD